MPHATYETATCCTVYVCASARVHVCACVRVCVCAGVSVIKEKAPC